MSANNVKCPKCKGTGWTQWAINVQGNCTECMGFGVVADEHSPAPDVIEVTADVLPDDVTAILALTPHAADDTPWAEREALAAAVADASAAGLADSWWAFVAKPVNYEPDGNVLWA